MSPDYGQWKPIETVPDEGNFLFYIPTERDAQDDGIYEGSRTKTGQGKILTIIGQLFDFDRGPASHWMEKPSPPEPETSTPNFVNLDRWVVYLQNKRHGDEDWKRTFCCLAENERHAREQATSNDSECWEIIRCELAPPQNFDEFLEVYGFVENAGKFACGGSIDDKSYGWETFSPDIDEVVKIANSEPGRVHTVVDGDDGRLWLTSGYHLVNRVFYIITQKPYLGPDFDIPCEDPKDFNRLDFEAFKAVDLDEDIYWAENGGYYDKQAFLDLAKGSEELAYRIYSLCEWQCPETVIDEDLREDIEDCAFPGFR
ncbi:hypothetical protein ICN48_07080 [Polynucleobacter sp. JS-Safj-400b-B2]|uniref:hypothetical protein n=1 Tax=Polynucleobacter sp. JS-Safj-400b-B2 TaxID=2576921 RepID=UPI001C0B523A|nr:hypothetical protein [Polynucleobacter sp. JS-Safj-400b-B2]MBU3625997.1 hypothetical protein [Polynucleobacter sp. JS-Safj-400b-B2]